MATRRSRSSIDSCPPRWSTPRNPTRETHGGRLAKVAVELGFPLMPWQRHVADVALEIDPRTGLLVYRQVVLTVPRQSGKTTLILALMVLRCLFFGPRQVVVYAAQTRNDARKKWEDDQLPILDGSPFGPEDASPFYRVRKTNGNEAVLWRPTGSRYGITSNTEKAGHGGTIDEAFIDEAFSQVDHRLEQAFKPAMITRPQPQLYVVSTAGTPESLYLREKVDAGRAAAEAGQDHGVAYFEWSAPDDADPADPATWWGCMPALGRTVTEAAVRGEFESMKLVEFQRAFLNQWRDRAALEPVIDLDAWAARKDARSQVSGPFAVAVDTSPDRQWTAVSVVGARRDGIPHAELVAHRRGTHWVTKALLELRQRDPVAVVIDAGSPAGSLIPMLVEAGFALARGRDDHSPGLIHSPSVREIGQACGALYDAVVQDKIRHLGQEQLTAALQGATKRPLGDAWAWSRKNSAADITPIVSLTLALWGWQALLTDPGLVVLDGSLMA